MCYIEICIWKFHIKIMVKHFNSTEMFAKEFQKQSNNFALNTHFHSFIEAMSIATALCEPLRRA